MLTPERWRRVEALFDEAVLLPAADRAAWVAERCAADAELHHEIVSLLAAEAGPDAAAALVRGAASEWADGDTDALVGRDIDGYRVLCLLGAGGMGRVYVARELALKRQVALKVLPSEFSTNDRRVRLFADEALAASALNHPNIVTVYRIGELEGRQYIATELVDGETLRARIAGGPLPAAEAIAIAGQVASALGQAHDAGIVHRDIKPENIVVRFDGLVKVIDFGLAKLEPQRPGAIDGDRAAQGPARLQSGAVAGTVDYMAPEQAAGGLVDHRADLFSVCVVLHETLTGLLPDGPAGTAAGIAAPLLDVVRRGLAADPAARYQSAEALRQDLESAGRSLNPAVRAAQRWRMAAAATLVAFALMAIGGSAYLMRARAGPSDQPIRSLVVLPFTSLDAATDQKHLELGMAEAVISRLAALPNLSVPTTAAIRAGEDAFEAARRLEVDGVLTGTIQRAGDRIRVAAQLSRASNGRQIWAQRFDAPITDIFDVQDGVAERIAASLQSGGTASDRSALRRRETANVGAYELYLKGREQWARLTPESIQVAIRMYREAIQLDPEFSLAFSGLAMAYSSAASGLAPQERYPLAKAAADQALALAPELADAHAARSVVAFKADWDWDLAEREIRRALELEPDNGNSAREYGELLALRGKFDLAIAALRRATALDPYSIVTRASLATLLIRAGDVAGARASVEAGLRQDPTDWSALRAMAEVLAAEGREDESIETDLEAKAMAGDSKEAIAALRDAYRRGGRSGYLQQQNTLLLSRLGTAATGDALGLSLYGAASSLALNFAMLRDREQAIRWLLVAADRGEQGPLYLNFWHYDFVRDDPRFKALFRRVFGDAGSL